MAAGLVLAGAADADGHARGRLGDEFDGLASGGVGEQLALVFIEDFLERGGRTVDSLLDFGDELGAGGEDGEPDVEVAVFGPALSRDAARRKARHADAQALFGLGGSADLEGGEIQLLRHG